MCINALIFWAIINFENLKEFNEFAIVDKPRASEILQWEIFWKKEELNFFNFLCFYVK